LASPGGIQQKKTPEWWGRGGEMEHCLFRNRAYDDNAMIEREERE
jgi:hypothetical protein